jgi:hypothetical protein
MKYILKYARLNFWYESASGARVDDLTAVNARAS